MSYKKEIIRLHNNSGISGLAICEVNEETFLLHFARMEQVMRPLPEAECLVEGSPCIVQGDVEGRYSFKGKKITFGHHLAARKRWGLSGLLSIHANKTQESLTISHVCGTRRCCVPSHLILESKQINDERTYCHYALLNVLRKSGRKGVQHAYELGVCNHEPRCGMPN